MAELMSPEKLFLSFPRFKYGLEELTHILTDMGMGIIWQFMRISLIYQISNLYQFMLTRHY